ncbi:MAG: MATE family efflux transporter [Chitinophagales bacterium]|nr:MATE family efflux transporter [Chitinophagales bacterium]
MAQLQATYKEIFRIATPLILGNVAWTFNGVFDTIFVGNLGKVELDAIGFAGVFYSVLFMMGFSFTRGTQLLIARRMGEGNKKEVGNIFDNTVLTLLAVSALLFVLIKVYSHNILTFMLHNADIISACDEFLNYRMWGLVPSYLSFIFIAFYSGIGKTQVLSVSIVIMTFLNIFLNYGLVYGKFGMPEMGIGGSGMATSISETIAIGVMFLGTLYKNRRQEFHLFGFLKFDGVLLRQMVKISFPLMLQALVAVGGWLVFFARIETTLGKDALAVSSIYRQLILFFTIPTWSLGSTANTIISNLVGQRNIGDIKTAIRRISFVSLGFACVSSLLIFLFPDFCIGIFINRFDSVSLLPMAKESLPVIFVIFILMSFSNIVFNGVISVGDIFIALGIEVVVVILYIGYFMILLSQPWANVWWVWTAEWVYWVAMFTGSIMFLRYRHLEIV